MWRIPLSTVLERTGTVWRFASADDHFQDLKRIIGACSATAHRVNVVMPFLYESRQHKRSKRESLDCAMALEELAALGVENIITFDAHDPRGLFWIWPERALRVRLGIRRAILERGHV